MATLPEYTAPDARLVTDPSINDQGKVAFSLFDEGITNGIFVFDTNTQTVKNVLPPTGLNLENFTSPTITNKNEIFFRGTNGQKIRSFFLFGEKLYNIVSKGNSFSYLFKPSISNLGFIASKVRVGDLGKWTRIPQTKSSQKTKKENVLFF